MEDKVTNLEFKRRIHYEANKYLDILTIMQQMEKNGFVDKLYSLLNEIYEQEHKFTMSELRKLAKKAKNDREEFDFIEYYSCNTSIFKQNLNVIIEMLVETIWNAKLNRVYKTMNQAKKSDIHDLLAVGNSPLDRVGLNENFGKANHAQPLYKELQLKPDLTGYFTTQEQERIERVSKLAKSKNFGSGIKQRASRKPTIGKDWNAAAPKIGKSVINNSTTGSIAPGPGSYSANLNSVATASKRLGKFGKSKRKTAFDKTNRDTYNFKEMKRKKLGEL